MAKKSLSKQLKAALRKGYIVKTAPKEHTVCFKKGRKVERCFRYTDTGTRWRPSPIKDPINWEEDVKPVSQPKKAYTFNLYERPYLWDAMQDLNAKLGSER